MFSRLMSITNHLYWLITTYTGPPIKDTSQMIFSDALKAFVGLGVSIIITFGRPILEKMISK